MPGRHLNTSSLRDELDDGRVWCVLARVELHKGETQHWEVNDDGDLEIQVVTHQGQEIPAILGALVGGRGRGVWSIPDIGTEVVLAFGDGDYEGDPVIVGVMPSKQVPAGLTPGQVLVIGAEVIVKDAGTASPLAKLSDVQALRDTFNNHGHVYSPGPSAPVATPGPSAPTGLPTSYAAAPSGTSVLKAE